VTVGLVLLEAGPCYFNHVCQIGSEKFKLTNRTTVSRCLKALVRKGMAERKSEGKGKRTWYTPNREKIADAWLKFLIRQETQRRRVPRLPGVRLPKRTRALPLTWTRHLESLPALRSREKKAAILKSPGYHPSGALLDVYLSTIEPNLSRRLRSIVVAQERRVPHSIPTPPWPTPLHGKGNCDRCHNGIMQRFVNWWRCPNCGAQRGGSYTPSKTVDG
jgi:hypothetical protein